MSAKIIEESENLKGERMATVQTARGDEYIVNLDQLACVAATIISDLANEQSNGWTLNVGWYEGEVLKLHSAMRRAA